MRYNISSTILMSPLQRYRPSYGRLKSVDYITLNTGSNWRVGYKRDEFSFSFYQMALQTTVVSYNILYILRAKDRWFTAPCGAKKIFYFRKLTATFNMNIINKKSLNMPIIKFHYLYCVFKIEKTNRTII